MRILSSVNQKDNKPLVSLEFSDFRELESFKNQVDRALIEANRIRWSYEIYPPTIITLSPSGICITEQKDRHGPRNQE